MLFDDLHDGALDGVGGAPGYTTVREMPGGAMGGYCAMGSVRMASTPASIRIRAITQAKTGRSIKNLAIGLFSSRLEIGLGRRAGADFDDADGAARRDFLEPFHDDFVAGFDALGDQPWSPMARSVLSVRSSTLSSAPTTRTVGSPREIAHDGLLRNQEGLFIDAFDQARRTNMPGSNSRRALGNKAAQRDRAGRLIDRHFREFEDALVGILRAVLERQRDIGRVRGAHDAATGQFAWRRSNWASTGSSPRKWGPTAEW